MITDSIFMIITFFRTMKNTKCINEKLKKNIGRMAKDT